MSSPPPTGILLEAESFTHPGGWLLDSQFALEMGSPYLIAHGNGIPVADAVTTLTLSASQAGAYRVWVRAKDWVPAWHPGRFRLVVGGKEMEKVFGVSGGDWAWERGGSVVLGEGETEVRLRDETGFCARCDAVFFSKGDEAPPEGEARAWRKSMLGLPEEPEDAGGFDVVVVGGGIVGAAAALTAARLGERVALVHNRPVLGGNASVEIGLRPRGVVGPLVEEVYERGADGDIGARQALEKEPTASLFLDMTVYNATTQGSKIVSVDARDARTNREYRFTAPVFIDCTGRAIFGTLAGAETLYGQEAQSEYGESLAPPVRESFHHGNTLFFRTAFAPSPVPFPPVPWALEVSKDYANLSGQLVKPGLENGPGPAATPPDPSLRRRMKAPLTHFWEYGQYLDPYRNGEHIRDHLLRALYGTFSNVKTLQPAKHANLVLDHVAFVPAQGEFARYKGAYVLSERDIRQHTRFSDAVARNGGAFCLHHPPPREAKYAFRLRDWTWDERDGLDYDVPFRCLYSANIANLMMAGKHISVTRVAGSSTKFMGNGGQHGIAVAVAAWLGRRHGVGPGEVGERFGEELKAVARGIAGEGRFPGGGGKARL